MRYSRDARLPGQGCRAVGLREHAGSNLSKRGLSRAAGWGMTREEKNGINKYCLGVHSIVLPLVVIAIALACATALAPRITTVKIGGASLQVEIADNPMKRAQGLSGRKFMPENSGMLFIFDKPAEYAFWMKDMLVPLDFIWIRQGVVVEVIEDVRPDDFPPPRILTPRQAVDQVIEVKAGTVRNLGIKVGDSVSYLSAEVTLPDRRSGTGAASSAGVVDPGRAASHCPGRSK